MNASGFRLTLRVGSVAAFLGALPPLATADLSGSYLYREADSLSYLRLTELKGELKGFMQIVVASPSEPTGFRVRSCKMTGSVGGKRLTMEGAFFACEGVVNGRNLKLQVPMKDGRTSTLTFAPTSEGMWNKAVAKFQERQGTMAQIRAVLRMYSEYRSHVGDTAQRSARQFADANAKLTELQKRSDGTANRLATLTKKLKEANSKVAAARKEWDELEGKAKAADLAAERENTEQARDRASAARDAARDAFFAVTSCEYDVTSAEFDVRSCQSDLDSLRDDSARYEEQKANATLILTGIRAASEILNAPQAEEAFKPLGRGRISIGILTEPAISYGSPTKESETNPVNLGDEFSYVLINSRWSIAAIYGKIRWIETA